MPAIIIAIKTLEPLLATSFRGDPNSDVSYDYIPGSMLRGALVGRYLKQQRLRELDLEEPKVNRLFFSDDHTRYLNGYLLSGQRRTLPIPRSWRQEKGAELSGSSGLRIFDFSVDYDDELASPKAVSEQFWCEADGCIYFHRPDRRVNIHNQRDRTKGRSSMQEGNLASEGEVFRYDALEAGQTFQAVILCEEQDVTTIESLLKQEDIWIGGSRSAGYGHAKLSYEICQGNDDWQESNSPVEDRAESEGITITLLSHTLLRDEWGQPVADPSLLPTAVRAVLGDDVLRSSLSIFSGNTLIGGFNRKWGLPLPQVPALVAGTVIVLDSGELEIAQIRQLEWQGIGDRRNEGFGRIAINSHTRCSFIMSQPEASVPTTIPAISDAASYKMASDMAEKLLRKRLEHRLKKQLEVNKLKRSAEGKIPISNSQLSRIGTAARMGLSQEPVSLEPIENVLNNLAKIAMDQFKAARMDRGGGSFYEQLERWIDEPTEWMGNLAYFDVSIGNNVNRRIEANRSKEDVLAIEFTLRLIAAVSKQAYKESVPQEIVQ